jgi:hypothetical protein
MSSHGPSFSFHLLLCVHFVWRPQIGGTKIHTGIHTKVGGLVPLSGGSCHVALWLLESLGGD